MKTITSILAFLIVSSCLSGCYVYTNEPLPPPAVIVAHPGVVVTPAPARPAPPPPAPSGPPAGAIGPPQ